MRPSRDRPRGDAAIIKRISTAGRGKGKHPEIPAYVPPVLRGASATRLIETAADLAKQGGTMAPLQLLAAALKASPRHPQGHLLRLELLRKVGPEKDLPAWLGSLRAMYERAEATPSMVLELALAEERLGDPEVALDHYQEVVALGAVRAAPPQLVELAHGGVLRCEAALRKGDPEEAEEEPAPVKGKEKDKEKGRHGAEGRGKTAPGPPPAPGPEEAPSTHATQILTGRGSMQLRQEEPPPPVELPVTFLAPDGQPRPGSSEQGRMDGLACYRLAEEFWGNHPDWLRLPRVAPADADEAAFPFGATTGLAPTLIRARATTVADELRGRALLALERDDDNARLALAVLRLLCEQGRLHGPVLVLAPSQLLPLWARDLRGLEPIRALLLDPTAAEARLPELVADPPELVLVDQAQLAASPDSKIARLIQQIAAGRLLLLSATPVVSDLLSLHGLVSLVRPGLLDSASVFRRTHVGKNEPWQPQDAVALRQLLARAVIGPTGPGPTLELELPSLSMVSMQEAPDGADPAWLVEEVVQWTGRVAGSGLLLSREAQVVERLRARPDPAWEVAWDRDPLPTSPRTHGLVVHLDLPDHPVDGALRAERFSPELRQVAFLPSRGVEALLAGLGPLACGLPAFRGARLLLRMHLRARDGRTPREQLGAAWLAEGPAAATQAAQELQQELQRCRELSERSLERSLALWQTGPDEVRP